jgi:sortase (surface protein transpeptidase)
MNRRTAALTGAAVLGVLAVLFALLTTGGGHTPVTAAATPSPVATTTPAPTTTSATPVPTPVPTPGETAVTAVTAPSGTTTPAQRSSSMRLEVPSVGVDVPVLPLTPSDGVIDPPTMVDSYWIEPYGEPGGQADNTVYIAGHSWTKGAAAFNPLMPGDHGRGVSTGDVVEVQSPGGTVDYTITGTARYDKDALPDATDVWTVAPGRLVLITCFVDDDGRTTDDNFIVFAES